MLHKSTFPALQMCAPDQHEADAGLAQLVNDPIPTHDVNVWHAFWLPLHYSADNSSLKIAASNLEPVVWHVNSQDSVLLEGSLGFDQMDIQLK